VASIAAGVDDEPPGAGGGRHGGVRGGTNRQRVAHPLFDRSVEPAVRLSGTDHSQGWGTSNPISVAPGELIMGDRMYGRPTGVGHVCGGGADLLVRINLKNMPLFTAGGQRLNVLAKLRTLKVKQPREWRQPSARLWDDRRPVRGTQEFGVRTPAGPQTAQEAGAAQAVRYFKRID